MPLPARPLPNLKTSPVSQTFLFLSIVFMHFILHFFVRSTSIAFLTLCIPTCFFPSATVFRPYPSPQTRLPPATPAEYAE